MTHRPYTYTILRYVHDIRTGEFLNVGVVLHVAGASDVLFRTRTTCGRVRSVFPDLDGEVFRDAMSAVRCALSAVTKDAELSGLFGRGHDAASIARRVLPVNALAILQHRVFALRMFEDNQVDQLADEIDGEVSAEATSQPTSGDVGLRPPFSIWTIGPRSAISRWHSNQINDACTARFNVRGTASRTRSSLT